MIQYSKFCTKNIQNEKDFNILMTKVFPQVFRFDFNFPGFCLIDFGKNCDPITLKTTMTKIKQNLSNIYYQKYQKYLVYLSTDRTSRQFTTKFHLEATPHSESILMLGYEPSTISSSLHINDYSNFFFRNNFDPKSSIKTYLQTLQENPDAQKYTTAIDIDNKHFQLILLNNSFYTEKIDEKHMLGVMHKGVVPRPIKGQTRIINAIALGISEEDQDSSKQEEDFIHREEFTRIGE